VTYNSTWGTGFATDITNLGGAAPCAAASAATACLIDSLLSVAPFQKSGYFFAAVGTLASNGNNYGFEVNGTPITVQTTGVRAFCSDQSGVISFVSPGAAAIGTGAGTCAAVATNPGVSGPIGN
jgi:hypothetical protein